MKVNFLWVLLAFTGGFIVGVPVGIYVKSLGNKETMQSVFAWFILLIWMSSFVAAVTIDDYRTPIEIHAALGMAGGWLFGQGMIKGFADRFGGKSDEKGPE